MNGQGKQHLRFRPIRFLGPGKVVCWHLAMSLLLNSFYHLTLRFFAGILAGPGALSTAAGHETHSTRLCQMTQLLHELGVGLAITGEPRFGDGMVWPSWTGYSFIGARSPQNDSVRVLILTEIAELVTPIVGFGSDRSIWMAVRTGKDLGILILAAYAPPSNRQPAERLNFFQDIAQEIQQLMADVKYARWPIMIAGDLNIHDSRLCEKNLALQRPVDRDILHLLENLVASGRHLLIRNHIGVSTHISGTAIDLVLSTNDLAPDLTYFQHSDLLPASDHSAILISQLGRLSPSSKVDVGQSHWCPYIDQWEEALAAVEHCMIFLGNFIVHLLYD